MQYRLFWLVLLGLAWCFLSDADADERLVPHYATNFDTVEINVSFYSWPTPAGAKAWLRGLRGDVSFLFTVKANELITHIRRFEDKSELVRDFGYVADLLRPRVGCLLYQLPRNVYYDADLLRVLVAQMEPGRRSVVEFRPEVAR